MVAEQKRRGLAMSKTVLKSSATPLSPTPSGEPPPSTYKIVLIGSAGVGKTALRERYLEKRCGFHPG